MVRTLELLQQQTHEIRIFYDRSQPTETGGQPIRALEYEIHRFL